MPLNTLRALVTQRQQGHSVLTTCKQQDKSAVDVWARSLQAHFGAGDVPVLLPG